MGRIGRKFQELRSRGEKALITFITAGDPSLEETRGILLELQSSGADLVEIGMPFSDPTADGPVIQGASQRALAGGVNLPRLLEMVSAMRKDLELPLVLFSYYNPVLAYGPRAFARDAREAGLDGVLIVDLPMEEWRELRQHTDRAGLDFIPLVAPTTGRDRMERMLAQATGFVYCISSTAVTGTTKPSLPEVRRLVGTIRELSALPVAVGFGISSAEEAAVAASVADAVVVGSVLVDLIHMESRGSRSLDPLVKKVKELKRALLLAQVMIPKP